MRYAVSMFNQFFINQGFILRMKKYYLHHSRHISTKEFKILHVPKTLTEELIKDRIRSSLNGIPFYIRANGGEKDSKKEGHKTIFFTIKDPHDCHRIKNQWSIELHGAIYRMCPAYFSENDLKERKKYQAEYEGFKGSHTMPKVLEVLLMHNPKNLY